jgi:hypothetical protein
MSPESPESIPQNLIPLPKNQRIRNNKIISVTYQHHLPEQQHQDHHHNTNHNITNIITVTRTTITLQNISNQNNTTPQNCSIHTYTDINKQKNKRKRKKKERRSRNENKRKRTILSPPFTTPIRPFREFSLILGFGFETSVEKY